MKKLVVLLSMVATVSAFSQGQVNFVTKNSTSGSAVDAPVTYSGGPANGIRPTSTNQTITSIAGYVFGGINARAALYAKAGTGNSADSLSIITPNVPFYNLNALAGYVNATASGGSKTRDVPGTTAGEGSATFQIRAFDMGITVASNTMSFETAKAIIDANHIGYYGVGMVGDWGLGGGSVAAKFLVGYAPFTINFVPEPSIIGLGILGALAGLFVFRRRN
jgi:hypothetical protein